MKASTRLLLSHVRADLASVPHFLSVDPGKKTGWAEWLPNGRLVACGLTDGDAPVFPEGLPLLVIERPWGQGKSTAQDIVTLARRMGSAIAAARTGRVIEVLPVQWKGSVPKVVRLPNGRTVEPALDAIRRKMTDADRVVFARGIVRVAKSAQNNVLDAVGLGLWFLESRGVR